MPSDVRTDTVLSPTPPGAGRTADVSFPAPVTFFAGINVAVYSRINVPQGVNAFTLGSTGLAGSTTPTLYLGAPAYLFQANAAGVPGTGLSWRLANAGTNLVVAPPRTSPGGTFGAGAYDPWRVFRIYANMALPGVPASDQDYGMEVLFPPNLNAAGLIANNIPGLAWIRRASGAVSVVVNGPGGISFVDAAPPVGFDAAKLNSYEFRFTGPSGAQPSAVQALLNGAVVVSLDWSPGTILPSYNGLTPMLAQVINYAGQNIQLIVQAVRWISAPNLLNTL